MRSAASRPEAGGFGVMHLTVKCVWPVARPAMVRKVRNGSAEEESFGELLPRAEPSRATAGNESSGSQLGRGRAWA